MYITVTVLELEEVRDGYKSMCTGVLSVLSFSFSNWFPCSGMKGPLFLFAPIELVHVLGDDHHCYGRWPVGNFVNIKSSGVNHV